MDSEQRLFLKSQDKMQQMRLGREKPLKKLQSSRKFGIPVPACLEFPCRGFWQRSQKQARTFVRHILSDTWQVFAKQLRRKAAGAGLWVFRLQECTREADLKIIQLWGVPAELN